MKVTRYRGMDYYGSAKEELDRLIRENRSQWRHWLKHKADKLWHPNWHEEAYGPPPGVQSDGRMVWYLRGGEAAGEVMHRLNALKYECDGQACKVDWFMLEAMWCEGWKGYRWDGFHPEAADQEQMYGFKNENQIPRL